MHYCVVMLRAPFGVGITAGRGKKILELIQTRMHTGTSVPSRPVPTCPDPARSDPLRSVVLKLSDKRCVSLSKADWSCPELTVCVELMTKDLASLQIFLAYFASEPFGRTRPAGRPAGATRGYGRRRQDRTRVARRQRTRWSDNVESVAFC